MAIYTQYELKTGTRWQVRGYLGVDKSTNKKVDLNKKGFKTKKEAQAFYTRAKNEFNNGDYETNKTTNLTFNQVYQEWFEMYKVDVKESTANKTVNHFKLHILPAFGHIYMDRISVKQLQTAVNEWHSKMGIYKKLFNYTKNIFSYALKLGYIKKDLTQLVFVPKKSIVKVEKTTKDFYNRSELETLLGILEQEKSIKWYTAFRLLAFTGLRRGELLTLTWTDINFTEGLLTVNKTLTTGMNNKLIVQSPKTEAGNRTITIDDKTITTLKKWKTEQAQLLIGFGFNAMNPNQLLFSQVETNTHLHLTALRNKLYRLCRLNDLEMINVHGFRHTHCSLLFEAGVSIKDVKARLGHEDIQTTMNVYTHVTEESQNKSAELFAKYVNF